MHPPHSSEAAMFDMDLPWWEFVARGALVYVALLAMVRLSGRRTISQLTPFDLLVVMLYRKPCRTACRAATIPSAAA